MRTVLLIWGVTATVAAVVFLILFIRYYRRVQLAKASSPGHVRSVRLGEFDPHFEHDELGPTLNSEVRFIGTGDGVPGGTSDREAWILAVLAKGASRMFEFGTCTGRTTYLLAANSPPVATVTTLTLPPSAIDQYHSDPGDVASATQHAISESRFARFRYSGSDFESKIEQLYGDSKAFDETPYVGACDLVFIDGSHAYSYVRSDSEKAFRMARPGAIILWHDYRARSPAAKGVFDYLNDLQRQLPLVHLHGTALVAYRVPTSTNEQSRE